MSAARSRRPPSSFDPHAKPKPKKPKKPEPEQLKIAPPPLTHPNAGPRQTLQRCKHPTLGEGLAILGPNQGWTPWFAPDADVDNPIVLKSIELGGASSSPRRSWLVAVTMAGERTELDTTDRRRGARHERATSKMLGAGWLVDLPVDDPNDFDALWNYRFESDAGGVADLTNVRMMYHGEPGMKQKQLDAYEGPWTTFSGPFGDFVWKRGEP